ncbi:MAG TPA: AAA family ATPase, partial [Planctomycetota bacterium]|nr:AAA family ATPase [Planctomycetota bacterium]
MKLTHITLHGFKSFADKTVFDIHAGVTCVVGPNGCGKSNIVESVRWVLGEQSIKQLRGTDRTDVIFQGSSSRKALNMAEVSLTFDNKSRKLNYPAEEVTITRRLYRSGESQYLINRNQCLLRNIRELFLDTGVGTSSYSIIQQGRVKALIESNGKDRRHVFEEAAGIGKYMVHRGRTMRTLERIQNRLDAFRGILTDARKQYKLALKQAERTLEAENIRKQLEGQQKVLYLIQYSDATEQMAQLGAELAQLETELKNSDERRAKLSEDEASTQRNRNESSNRSYQIKTQSIETEGQIARLNSEAVSQQAMADSEEKLSIQTAQRADEMQKQSVEARMSAETARADLASAESERQPQAQTCAAHARDLAAARKEQESLAQAEEAAARDQSRTQQDLARTGAELGALRARIEANRRQQETAERERNETAAALTRLQEQGAAQDAEITARETERADKRAALADIEKVCAELEQQRSQIHAEQELLVERAAKVRARAGAADSFLAAQLQKSTSPAMVCAALQKETKIDGTEDRTAGTQIVPVQANSAASS